MTELRGRTHELFEVSRGGKQGGRGLAAESRLTRGCHIVEDMEVLLLEGRHDGHHRFGKAGALRTVGAKAPFAPEDAGTNRPFGRIVGRFHPLYAHGRPQGLPQREDLAAHPFGLRNATGLPSFEQPLHLPPDGAHVDSEAGGFEGAVTHPMPPVEHLSSRYAQGPPEISRTSPALD